MARKKKPIPVDPDTGEIVEDQPLPGFECEDNPAIEKAARRFSFKKQEAKDCKDAADIAQEALLAVMHEHKITHYRKHGIDVILDAKERAIVQIVAP